MNFASKDVRCGWIELDCNTTGKDVRCGWIELDTAAVSKDVRCGWVELVGDVVAKGYPRVDNVGGGPEALSRTRRVVDNEWDWPTPQVRPSRDDKDLLEMLQMASAVGLLEASRRTCLPSYF